MAEADKVSETILTYTFDLDEIAKIRDGWVVFRDRRPSMYRAIMTMDGENVDDATHF